MEFLEHVAQRTVRVMAHRDRTATEEPLVEAIEIGANDVEVVFLPPELGIEAPGDDIVGLVL